MTKTEMLKKVLMVKEQAVGKRHKWLIKMYNLVKEMKQMKRLKKMRTKTVYGIQCGTPMRTIAPKSIVTAMKQMFHCMLGL